MPIAAKVKTPADSWACHVSRKAAEVPFSDGDESSSGFIWLFKASVVERIGELCKVLLLRMLGEGASVWFEIDEVMSFDFFDENLIWLATSADTVTILEMNLENFREFTGQICKSESINFYSI